MKLQVYEYKQNRVHDVLAYRMTSTNPYNEPSVLVISDIDPKAERKIILSDLDVIIRDTGIRYPDGSEIMEYDKILYKHDDWLDWEEGIVIYNSELDYPGFDLLGNDEEVNMLSLLMCADEYEFKKECCSLIV